ncbi:MAG: adenosylmethionine decarboxylase [Prochlorococcus sp. SP3034]|nr:adenosylmethionine decarboxylase [Prochlorococcus sp. SP3034]|tara:strand:- start:12450 stop:12893 length:444 start_codon:yes stop_codon:yes gene_type:complete
MEFSQTAGKVEIFSKGSNDKKSDFHGKHLILELYECNHQKLNDELYLRCLINNSAKLAKATVLNLISNKFEPYGVTAIALLAESHLSIHTWPESNYAAVDIFTCGANMQPELASQFLIENLEASQNFLKTINRNYPLSIENKLREPC